MRFIILGLGLFGLSGLAAAQSIDPDTLEFPWKNGPTRDARYVMAETPNTVTVFEAFQNFCGACNTNAPNVAAMSEEYADDDRVQFLDLGLDHSDSEYTRWIARHAPPHPVVEDVGETVWSALAQSRYIPQAWVVDCAGSLVDWVDGVWGAAEKARIRAAIATAKETTCE